MKLKGLSIVVALLVAACGDSIPAVTDATNPVDGSGNPMTGAAFLDRYCKGVSGHESCDKVRNAIGASATRGEMPKGY